jgi:hypothetical protein
LHALSGQILMVAAGTPRWAQTSIKYLVAHLKQSGCFPGFANSWRAGD